MSLMDDDSSTYCSRQTRRSISLSQTPERGSLALEQPPEVASTGSVAHSLTGAIAETAEHQEPEQVKTSAEAHEGGAAPSGSAARQFSAQSIPDGKVTNTEVAGVASAEGAAEPENPEDAEDGASSIEFAIDDGTIPASKSSPPSIMFLQEAPVATSCETNLRPQRVGGGEGRVADTIDGNGAEDGSAHDGDACAEQHRCENNKPVEDAQKIDFRPSHEKAVAALVEMRRTPVESESRLQSGGKGRDAQGESTPRREGGAGLRSQRSSRGSCASLGSKNAEQMGRHGARSNSSRAVASTRSASEDSNPRKKWGSHGTPSARSYSSDRGAGCARKGFERRDVKPSPYRGRAPSSPRRAHGGACSSQTQTTPLRHTVVHSPALERFRRYRMLESPTPGRREKKEEILALLDDEMDTVRNEVRECDVAMERAMLRNPFERLYHMNNRRDRDERRSRILHYLKLDEAKQRLLAESAEDEQRRREWRREYERRREELFERLHFTDSARAESSQFDTSQSVRNGMTAANDALFERLYKEAVESMAEKQERARRAERKREQKEMEEALHARILARLEMETPSRRMLTSQERESRANAIQSELLQNPDQLREYLKTNRLSKKNEELLAWRLTRQGYRSAASLAQEKQKKELEGCTFRPKTNTGFNMRCCSAAVSYSRATLASSSRRKKSDAEPAPATSPQRSSSRSQKLACEELYKKAVKQR
ncbi:uncharacterized protein Tco025E_10084, partial [Trypanosoma conorhini]